MSPLRRLWSLLRCPARRVLYVNGSPSRCDLFRFHCGCHEAQGLRFVLDGHGA